jgi:hypothetical protein
MSKPNGYVCIDKMLAQDFKHINRPFSRIEAMFSYSVDVDNGNEGSFLGYATQWGWSRNKVRRFIESIRTVTGHKRDSKRTQDGHPIHFIDKGFWTKKDTNGTVKGQQQDTSRFTSNNPNPNPKEIIPHHSGDDNFYLTKKKRKLSGEKLESFNRFWICFNYKKDRASAADSWLEIPQLTDTLVDTICTAAEKEAAGRSALIQKGRTPIYAQGWLTARRWEDETTTPTNNRTPEQILKEAGFSC